MVTAQTQFSLANARSYFAEHLSVGDYYEEGQKVAGEWFGQGAARLGLSGRVGSEEFLRLCDNRHPATGSTLTPRRNGVRRGDDGVTTNRRVFYDFTFSPPKSVSLVALIADDRRLAEAHERAVRSALAEFEAFAATRVRRKGADENRATGNVIAALFTHDTSRALDPHIHTHAIVFNATWDPVEQRWKALQNQELLQARRFIRNAYYHELARELRRLGFGIRNRAQGDFEIEGVAPELCARFSKRHASIDDSLRRLLDEKPELAGGNVQELRGRIAASERARKQHDLSRAELDRLWKGQITPDELRSLSELSQRPGARSRGQVTLAEAVSWAGEHLFDRNSVVPEHRIWEEALGRARGSDFNLDALKSATRCRGYVRDSTRPGMVTTQEVLARELALVQIAREGRCEFQRPLAIDLVPRLTRPPSALWKRIRGQLARFGRTAVTRLRLIGFAHPKQRDHRIHHEHQRTRMLGD